jgi:hypothetical protein
MRIAIRTVVFHTLCILVFAFIYSAYSDDFRSLSNYNTENNNNNNNNNNRIKKERSFLDFLLFSTTIQAGVGISEFFPSTSLTKMFLITQQIIMISTHVFTLYFLTL